MLHVCSAQFKVQLETLEMACGKLCLTSIYLDPELHTVVNNLELTNFHPLCDLLITHPRFFISCNRYYCGELDLIDRSLIEDGVNRTTAILFKCGMLTNLKHVTQAIIQ